MMLKFNDFLKEQFDEIIQIDTKRLMSSVDQINHDLDTLTEKPYQNAPIFLTQMRSYLERFGILLPQEATASFLDLGAEVTYLLGETDHYLYIVYDTNDDGFVDGYAQIVDSEELEDLLDMDLDSDIESVLNKNRDPITMRPSTWYAKRDDDAGNSDEY